MRRGVTVLVVLVVAAIALAAGIDALRGERPPTGNQADTPSVPTTEPDAPTNYVPLEDRFEGTLYYTDESCELQAIELPAQTPVEAPGWDECRFVLSPSEQKVAGAGSGWDTHSDPQIGRLYQSENGLIQVATNLGPDGEPFRGTAPAWRPDGTLTYFADDAYRRWPEGTVILSQRAVLRAIADNEFAPLGKRFTRLAIREAAWLDDDRLAAVMSAGTGNGNDEDLLAVYDGPQLGALAFEEPDGLSDLRVSPTGRYIAAKTSGRRGQGGFMLLTGSGASIDTLGIQGYRSIAWSPDEQWAAVAADGGVFVLRPGASGRPELELDLDAHDLAWRGEAGPPALAEASEVSEWLGGVRMSGRLFLTQAEGSACKLRALRLPELGWAEWPAGLPNPCRFTLDYRGAVLTEKNLPGRGASGRARCREGVLEWFSQAGPVARYPGACAAAWTPNYRLTFVRDGSLYEAWPNGDSRRLLSRNEVSEMLGRPTAIEEIAWAGAHRFWAVVRSGKSATLVLMTTGELVFSPSFTARKIQDLRANATGIVAASTDEGVVFLDSGGHRLMTFPNGRVVSWAPGQLVAAVATPSEVLFVAPLSREVVALPLAVRDLEWVVP